MAGVISAAAVCLAAGMVVFLTHIYFDPQSRWVDYYNSYRNAGWAVLIAGMLWFVLAFLKAKTDFFAIDRKIGSDELGVNIAVVFLATVVVLYLALSNLPSIVPPVDVQMEPAVRLRLTKMNSSFRWFVGVVIALISLIVLSVPLRRLFRK